MTSADQIIHIFPLPDNKYMDGNKIVINGIADKGIAKYTPNGEYELTASSTASGETEPYKICNQDEQDYWQCDYKSNPNYKDGKYSQYTQNPYTGGNTSSAYQGGGSVSGNTWTTPVGSSKISNVRGEWIQVRIPYNAYIQQYSIRTPTYTKDNTFPRKFILVASNDGMAWTQLDQRNLTDDQVPTGLDIKKTFDINATDKYSYFRLIINAMGPNVSTVSICEFGLIGTTMIGVNKEALKETFITLNRSIEVSDETTNDVLYNGINMYDKQYARYDISTTHDIEKESNDNNIQTNNEQQRQRQNQNKQTMDYLTQTSLVACAVLTSVFIYTLIRK